MSNDTQKADQIAYRFYTKLTLVVNNARATTAEPRTQSKVDKWFNLETPDSDLFKDHLRIYRSVSVSPHPPPFELQVLLSIPELAHNQVLVHLAPDSSRLRVDPTPRYILLESWRLSFNASPYPPEDQADVAPSTIYKHGIPLFRSLYSLLRILPAWKTFKRLRRRTGGGNRSGMLSIQLRVPALDDRSDNILGFTSAPANGVPPLSSETHSFPSVPHPMGTLSLSVTYLTTPNFQLDELESLLSSRFLSLDTGPEFTPTLAKNQQRDSLTGSRGSLPTRMSLPQKSPTSSVVDRFVLPSRVASLGLSPRNAPLPITRFPSATTAESNSGPSAGSSAWSKEDSRSPSGLPARLRKESAGLVSDLPSAPSPLPIRRPNINPVHPFKSSTLSSGSPSHHSSSTSLRQPSPLSSLGLPSLPSRPILTQPQLSPTSARIPPLVGSRPSPPFTPSSLGDRRSLTSAEGDRDREDGSPRAILGQGRKRYSSSFGHRYAASLGAGSEGSAGSGERREGERVGNASFLSTNTDDDDISVFVQDIDSRKPLSGRFRARDRDPDHRDPDRDRDRDRDQDKNKEMGAGMETDEDPEQRRSSRGGITVGGGEGSSQGAMLTNEVDVDERLRQMNAAFHASLEGLNLGRRERRTQGESQHGQGEGSESSAGSGARGGGSGARRGRIPADARGESSRGIADPSSYGGGGSGRGQMLLLAQHSPGSGSTNSSSGVGQGSEEVIGRLELDDGQPRSRRL